MFLFRIPSEPKVDMRRQRGDIILSLKIEISVLLNNLVYFIEFKKWDYVSYLSSRDFPFYSQTKVKYPW